jgi:hypothetical protein
LRIIRRSAGRCSVGITTQDPALESRLDVEEGARRIRNFLTVLRMEAQTLACACGKSHLHNLEPEDLAALTVEAAAMAGEPLAGTDCQIGVKVIHADDSRGIRQQES